MITLKSQLDRMLGKWAMKHNEPLSIRDLAAKLADQDVTADFLYRFRAIDLSRDDDERYAITRLDLYKLQALCRFFECTPNDLLVDTSVSEVARTEQP